VSTLLKSDSKFGNKYAYFSFQYGVRGLENLQNEIKLRMNGMKINEECTHSNGNQRSEGFYSPSHILNLFGTAATKKSNFIIFK
jgi:hypothetical protein